MIGLSLDRFERLCREVLTTETGEPLVLEGWQRRMLTELFEGTRETLVLIPKKNGKSTILAAIAIAHLLSVPNAECVIAAASRDQAAIMLRQAAGMVTRNVYLARRLKVKQREIVHRVGGGRIRVLASDVDTADGVIPTLALIDELHRHKSAELMGVLVDGLGPRDGQVVTISTAGGSYDTPLGELRKNAYRLEVTRGGPAYRHATAPGFAMHEWALEPDDDLDDLELVKAANPASWQTVDELRARKDSPSMRGNPIRWARFACGVWGLGAEPAFSREVWDALADPDRGQPAFGASITLGFDGARRRDGTAVVGCDVTTGHLFVLGYWQAPFDAGPDWEVPEIEVDDVIDHAFTKWEVVALYGDPPFWESALDRWAGKYGTDRVRRWWTTRIKAMALALSAFRDDMVPDRMSHDGDERLAEHIGNAERHDTRMREGDELLWVIRKDSRESPRKIDLAMAATLAWKARGDQIARGALEAGEYQIAQW